MKCSTVVVPWDDGLKFRTAARIMRTAQAFRSSVVLRCGDRIADMRSILGIVALCASMGANLTVEASGDDEAGVIDAITQVFDDGELD